MNQREATPDSHNPPLPPPLPHPGARTPPVLAAAAPAAAAAAPAAAAEWWTTAAVRAAADAARAAAQLQSPQVGAPPPEEPPPVTTAADDATQRRQEITHTQQHFEDNGFDLGILYLASIGLKDETGKDIMAPSETVWKNAVKPTLPQYKDEVERRWSQSIIAEAREKKETPQYKRNPKVGAPRPGQWTKVFITEWLTKRPIDDEAEVAYIRRQINTQRRLHDSGFEALDEIEDEEEEANGGNPAANGNPAAASTTSGNSNKKKTQKKEGWTGKYHIRHPPFFNLNALTNILLLFAYSILNPYLKAGTHIFG